MSIRHMNLPQIYAARDTLKNVIIFEQKFCTSIDKIEYAGEIERFGMRHYIFKFREAGGPWLLGVAGGYTDEREREPGEYVGTMGALYSEKTAQQSAIELLDDMKSYFDELDEEEAPEWQGDPNDPQAQMMEAITKGDLHTQESIDAIFGGLHEKLTEVGGGKMEPFFREPIYAMLMQGESRALRGNTFMQTVLLDRHVWKGKELRKYLAEDESFAEVEILEDQEGAFGFRSGSREAHITLTKPGMEKMAVMDAAEDCLGLEGWRSFGKEYEASLLIRVTDRHAPATEVGASFAYVLEACLAAYGKRVLGVFDGGIIRTPGLCREVFREAGDTKYPIELFLAESIDEETRIGSVFYTIGLINFDLPDLAVRCTDEMDRKSIGEAQQDLMHMALQLMLKPEQARKGAELRGASGKCYRLREVRLFEDVDEMYLVAEEIKDK